MRRSLHLPVILLLLAPMLSGCFYSREMSQVRRDIERAHPGIDFDRGGSGSFGPGMFRVLSWVSRQVPEVEAQMASDYLREISRVKVGYYPIAHRPPLDELDLPQLRHFEYDDWELAVKVQEDDEAVWLYYRERGDTVSDLFVIVLDDEALVVSRVKGHLNHLLELAVEDQAYLTDLIDEEW